VYGAVPPETVALNVTVKGIVPEVTSAAIVAVKEAITFTDAVALLCVLCESRTTNVTVYVPAV
jgi:hypothetical protein